MVKPKSITLGQRLSELRLAQGLTVYRLAQLSQVPAISIARIESGERQPLFATLAKIASGLGVSVAEFEEGKIND